MFSLNKQFQMFVTILLLLTVTGIGAAAHLLYQLQHHAQGGSYRFDLGNLAGFADRYSYRPGEKIRVYVHTTAAAKGTLYRYGKTLVDTGRPLTISETLQSDHYDQVSGFDWELTAVIETESLKPGFYGLHLEQHGAPSASFIIPFIIKPKVRSGISVVLSTNTWDAYNSFGGISNYENQQFSWLNRRLIKVHSEMAGRGNFHQVNLPRRRPNSLISEDLIGHTDPSANYHSHFARNEWSIIAFLEQNNYEYGVFSDTDLESGEALIDSRLLILAGHSEYWTAEMFNEFDRFVGSGGTVLLASGKPMAELVERQSNGLFVPQKFMSEQEIASRVGTTFSKSGAYTAAPYRVGQAQSWVFEGTELGAGDLFGDASSNHPNENYPETEPGSGASGLFTAKIGPGSADFVRIAHGLNSDGSADMVMKETESGGWVFNASSETFLGSVTRDPDVARIVLNLVNQSLTERGNSN
jgi:hypothetical protein